MIIQVYYTQVDVCYKRSTKRSLYTLEEYTSDRVDDSSDEEWRYDPRFEGT